MKFIKNNRYIVWRIKNIHSQIKHISITIIMCRASLFIDLFRPWKMPVTNQCWKAFPFLGLRAEAQER